MCICSRLVVFFKYALSAGPALYYKSDLQTATTRPLEPASSPILASSTLTGKNDAQVDHLVCKVNDWFAYGACMYSVTYASEFM